MTKRLLEHPSNRFDEWVAILQRSQAFYFYCIPVITAIIALKQPIPKIVSKIRYTVKQLFMCIMPV